MSKSGLGDIVAIPIILAILISSVLFLVIRYQRKYDTKACVLTEVSQESSLMRVPSCRQRKMSVAFAMCERSPVALPNTGGGVEVIEAPGIGVDECLATWMVVVDVCPDEADRQWKMVCK